jgi:hypothetical protein
LDSPISRLKKQLMETLISPDSESSSLHITSPTTSSDIKSDFDSADKPENTSEHTYTKEKPSELEAKRSPTDKTPMLLESDALNTARVLQRKSAPTIEGNNDLQEQEFVSLIIIYSL